jgi:heme-degrading monooxygenase HmoA
MLYAQILQVALKSGTAQQVADIFQTEVGPVLKQQPGYATSRFLTNTDTNRCLAVMLWESASHREAAENSETLQGALGLLQPCFDGPVTVDHYELAVQV